MRFETLAVHAGGAPEPATGAVMPSIHLSTTFERAKDGSYPSGYDYIRGGNPNRRSLEAALAQLEGGASAIAFASGMAASHAVFQALAPGDHVIAPLDAYFGTAKLLRTQLERWDVKGDATAAGSIIGQLEERLSTSVMFGGGTLAVLLGPGPVIRRNEHRDRLLAAIDAMAPGNALAIVEASGDSTGPCQIYTLLVR